MKLHNHFWLLIAIILVIALTPSVYARTTEKLGVFVDYNSEDKIATISNLLGEVVITQQIENTPQCINCHSLTKLTFSKDINYIDGNWKTNFNIVEGSMSNYKETIYYIKDETYSIDVNDFGKCTRDVNELNNKTGKNETNKVEYDCIIGTHKEEKIRQIKVVPNLKDGWKKGIDYFVLREATLKIGSLIDYIPVSHGVSIDEEDWWNAGYSYKRLVTFNTTVSSNVKVPYRLNSSVGINGNEIWAIPQESFSKTTNYSEYWYYNNFSDGGALVNFSEDTQMPHDSASGTERNYLPYQMWQSNNMPGVWHLNDTKNAANNSDSITWDGASTYDNGKFGIGRNFKGKVGFYATIPHNSVFDSVNMTACAWINVTGEPSDGVGNHLIVSKGSVNPTWLLALNGLHTAFAINWQWGAIGTTTVLLNKWYFVCGTYDSTKNTTAYLNGTAEVSVIQPTAKGTTTNSLIIGGRDSSTYYMANATIDEIRYWNRTLTGDEIKAMYDEGMLRHSELGAEQTYTPPPITEENINVNWTDLPYYTNSTMNLTFYILGNETKYNATFTIYNGTVSFQSYTVLNLLNNTLWSNKTITEQHSGETWNLSVTSNGKINSTKVLIQNTAPKIEIATIIPSILTVDNTTILTVNITDIDGNDKLSRNATLFKNNIAVYSSNISITSGVNSTASYSNLAMGDIVLWQIDAYNGYTHILSNTSSLTVQTLGIVTSYPLNNTNFSANSISFIFNADYATPSVSCSLRINNLVNYTNSSVITNINTTINATLPDGTYTWNINCSNGNAYNSSVNNSIRIDTTYPILNIFNPNGEYFTDSIPLLNIPINFSYTEANKDSCWYNIDYLENSIMKEYNCSGIFDATYTCSKAIDGDWNTMAGAGTSDNYIHIYENYTIPIWVNKANWTYKTMTLSSDGINSEYCLNYTDNSWLLFGFTSYNESLGMPAPFLNTTKVPIDCLKNILQIKTSIKDYYYEGKITFFGTDTNSTNVTIPSCSNSTFNMSNSGNHILYLFMNDTFGNENSSSNNFSINLYNSSSYTNKGNMTEGEIINFFLRVNSTNITSINATFYLNNTPYSFTNLTNTSITALFTKSLTIPSLPNGEYPFYWNYTLNSMNNITNITNITINQMIFGLCNSTLNITYLNISFKDETLLTILNGTIPLSTWTYGLSSNPSYTKSYSFVNASDNLNYPFCFSSIYETALITATIQYGGTGYPSKVKTITNQSLTNITTNMILYLLSTSEGLYSRYTTIDTASGINIVGTTVTVQRTIDGVLTTINSGVTDSSGTVTFWLNPDFEYTFTFVKSGYGTKVLNLRPTSSDVYYVSMTKTGVATPSINVTQGLNYNITPVILFLNNNTEYNFSFCAFSDENGIDTIIMNLTNGTSQQLVYITKSGQGCISNLFNTSNYTHIEGNFRVIQGTEIFEVLKIWTVQYFYSGSYSLMAWLGHFNDYNFGNGGLILKVLIMLIFIFGIAIGFSYLDVIDSSIAPMIGIIIGVAIFSYIGWFTIPISGNSFTNQWSVFIVMAVLNGSLIVWRTNTQ